MIYRVMISDSAIYDFDPNDDNVHSENDALHRAEQWFSERDPEVTILKLAPCQVDNKCPYSPRERSCSDCMKEIL